MSAHPNPVPEQVPAERCPQCATPVAAADERCPACGYDLAGIGERPGPYGRMWGVWAGLALAVTYVLALVVVLLGR